MNTNITIASSAVLVDLNLSVWTARKKDKKVSAEIDADKHTRVRAGNYNKDLMAGAQELEAITKYAASVRNWHAQQTLPWSDSGTRLIPTARLFDYQAELGVRENGFRDLVDKFLASYSMLVKIAPFNLAGLFNAADYPSADTIAAKFGFRYVFSPVPLTGDFRVDVGNEGLAELKAQYEQNQNRYIQQAMLDVWGRVRDVTERLSKQLRVDKHTGEKGKLYQSTLDNALELCDMLKSMNINNDPELEKIRKELYMTLNGVDLKELKQDEMVREGVKAELDALISKFSF